MVGHVATSLTRSILNEVGHTFPGLTTECVSNLRESGELAWIVAYDDMTTTHTYGLLLAGRRDEGASIVPAKQSRILLMAAA